MTREEAQKLISEEIDRQEMKWGKLRNQHPATWLTILTEEVGEMAKEICDSGFDTRNMKENYRTELIQVAAVAQSALIDSGNLNLKKD